MWGGKKIPTEEAFGRLFRGPTRSTIVSESLESWCSMFSTAPAIRQRHGKEPAAAPAKRGSPARRASRVDPLAALRCE